VSPLAHVHEGVYRLGTEWVGWYLLVGEDGITVVDCGFEGYYEQLPSALSQLGRSLDELSAVVLTHYHTDHVGSAERIRTEAGVTVFVPEGDEHGVRGERVPLPSGLLTNLWRPRMVRYLAHAGRNGGMAVTAVKELRTYSDGAELAVPGRLRAVHTPGHTGGHCSLVSEGHGVLFAGDALGTVDLRTGERGARLPPFNEDTDQARRSLARLRELDASVIVVGHGDPFEGSPAEAVEQADSRA
jgi:glyoxylase-like metal-dependent hydrolase (beta-lactamase superfamily II)